MTEKNFFEQKKLLPQPVTDMFHDWFGVANIDEVSPSIEQWFQSPLGASLLEAEQAVIDRALGYLFGYHLMQLSVDRSVKLYSQSKVNHCFGLHPLTTDAELCSGMCQFDQLPLGKGSIDVAILHHVIDFAAKPHRLLREVVRSVVPHGHVVIVGFNPVSMMGASRMVARVAQRKAYQRSHSIRMSRIIDWLRVLDCEPVRTEKGLYRLPLNNQFMLDKSKWFERVGQKILNPFGSFYVVIARKEQGATIPLKPQWQPVKPISGFSVGKVASRVTTIYPGQKGKVVAKVANGPDNVDICTPNYIE